MLFKHVHLVVVCFDEGEVAAELRFELLHEVQGEGEGRREDHYVVAEGEGWGLLHVLLLLLCRSGLGVKELSRWVRGQGQWDGRRLRFGWRGLVTC